MDDKRISLAHGNGGRFMRELIEDVFARQLSASEIDVQADAVPIDLGDGEVMITTDGFTVQPLEFPGGDIGSLAVHGTTNDLAVAGARPMYLTLNAFIEEGFETQRLERIVAGQAGEEGMITQGQDVMLLQSVVGLGQRLLGWHLRVLLHVPEHEPLLQIQRLGGRQVCQLPRGHLVQRFASRTGL